ncbi:hypothetical protein [[Phormidium] sp. ETS-05]|uniref:hypothetical protein n=1 Tax=[Phormidium] sp. ETS-05 TaxID=222819 RepID=UPI0018EF21E6|nr:hypothetical protein [[Phormidium] sp. ETS-05]
MTNDQKIGRYLTLTEFCTCSNTYRRYSDKINPFPQNPLETLGALENLSRFIIDPIIDHFGRDNFHLTYGFCSPDLKKYLAKKDPITGEKNGRVAPNLDQHMAAEINAKNQYYCSRPGAACDFAIINIPSSLVIDWILSQKLPFDSLYFYGDNRPIHISYGSQHKRDIWTFTETGVPTKKGIAHWRELAKEIPPGS